MKFIRSSIIILACFLSVVNTIAAADAAPRSRESFDSDWRFARFGLMPDGSRKPEPGWLDGQAASNLSGKIDESPSAADYDDAAWRHLAVPHDWGIEGSFRDDLDGGTGKLPWQGIGWYRKHFTIPAADQGKRLFVDFDGALANAEVWLNGNYVGTWPYGYNSFELELTPGIKFGAENVLAVRLDTEHWGSRWYPGAGIYRDVWLVKTAPVHVGHWGVNVTTPSISTERGDVKLIVTVQNQSEHPAQASVIAEIYEMKADDSVGKRVAVSQTVEQTIAINASDDVILDATVDTPKLWDVALPSRYLARSIVRVDGRVADVFDQPFGFRTIEFTARDGFKLNGRRLELQGTCNHHDLGPLGAAFNARAAERQLEILKEMGDNALRTSHNPPAPEFLDLADKMGFVVMDEAFDCWRAGKKTNDYSRIFDSWHERDLQAMVRRDRNHPSVIIWSIGNEIKEQNQPKLAKMLRDIVHAEDPTRPVTAACSHAVASTNGFEHAVDIFGLNYNIGFYATALNFPGNENIPMVASESSSCLSSRGECFFPARRGASSEVNFQVSSYDVDIPSHGAIPDDEFSALDHHRAFMGEFVWTGFDYLGEPTPYNQDATHLLNFTDPKVLAEEKKKLDALGKINVPSAGSYFGILDSCGFKKDRFYAYQARWRPELPMVHIFPHWNWPERLGQITPVHIYTSGDEAELFLNGKSLGRKKKGPFEYRLCWNDIVYKPGELKAVAYRDGKVWAEDVIRTTGPAAKLILAADRSDIKADGQDLSYVTVRVADKDGLLVPRSHNLVKFQISGPGEIVAVGNGDAASHEPFHAMQRSAFNGLCLAIIRSRSGQPGTIILKASADGLTDAEITVTSRWASCECQNNWEMLTHLRFRLCNDAAIRCTLTRSLAAVKFPMLVMKVTSVVAVLAGVVLVANQQVLSAGEALYLDSHQPVEARVEDLLSRLTLEEKIAVIHADSKFATTGISRLGIPRRWLSDGPMGVGHSDDPNTAMPAGICLAATWNPELAHAEGAAIGQEARARGKDIMLGPGVNIFRTPLCGRNFEYFGEDPFLASRMAVGYIQGEQSQDIASCVKHFVANNQELNRATIDVEMDERVLQEIYLPAFKAAVQEAGVWSVMGGYNQFRGQHCCENGNLLNTILKNEWGFQGMVISDWGGTHNTFAAATNGLDLEMGTSTNWNAFYLAQPYRQALEQGDLPLAGLDDKVRRNLRVMFATHVFDPDRKPGSLNTTGHQMIARQVAEEGIVLLKNEGNLLPLDPNRIKSIAVIGENAVRAHDNGGGSSKIKSCYEITPLEGIVNRVGQTVDITYSQGYQTNGSLDAMERAVKAAKAADVVIFVGGVNHDSGLDYEGVDRAEFRLPYAQDELIRRLIAANPKTIIVMEGCPAAMDLWAGQAPAILQAWYPGMEGGNALARVLFGDVNPSGKLPCTIPRRLEDSPAHALGAYPGTNGVENYAEGLLVGYRWFDTKDIAPLFPFGHGLSYTHFAYSNLKLVSSQTSGNVILTAQFDVANTGSRAGETVAELYVHQERPRLPRPEKELKGFKKILLKPGEKQTVSIPLAPSAFAYFDPAKSSWVAERDRYQILIGESSRDIRLISKFRLPAPVVFK